MPTIPTVLTGATFVNGLRTAFNQVYKGPTVQGAFLADCMDLGLGSDSRQEIYGYHETAPYPSYSPYGDTMRFKAFKSKVWTTVNYPYKLGIGWNRFDRNDDKLGDLMAQAMTGANHFLTLPERVLFEIMLGSTTLLPAVPTAPDGVAAYYATDGDGAARFGVSGGNIISGSGVATGAAIRADVWSACQRVIAFQDTEGQPLFEPTVADHVVLVYNSDNEAVVREAVTQGRTLAAAVTATSNAAVTNTILESGKRIDLWGTQRLRGTNDMFAFFPKAPYKPFYRQTRDPVTETFHTYDNSDHAALTDEEWVQWVGRDGYGVGPCYGTVKIDN